MKRLVVIMLFNIFFIGAIFFGVSQVLADGTNPVCPSIYGVACPNSQIYIDKKVQNPKSGEFVDILSATDVTFAPDQEVNFRIEVKNTGSTSLTQVFTQDRFPSNINFISGPSTFDQNNRVLSWTIDNLGAGESKFFQIKAKVQPKNELQFDIACMTNYVQTQKDQQIAQDTTVFCIQAQPLKVLPSPKQLPATGLPAAAWLASLLIPTGLRLRKFAANDKDDKDDVNYMWQMREFLKRGGDVN